MKSFFKYFLAMLTATGLDYVVTASCLYVGIVYYLSIPIGIGIGAVTGFFLLAFWVFPSKKQSITLKRSLGFLSGVGLVYVVRTCIMWLWFAQSYPEQWQYVALFFSYGCSFIANFLLQKYLVFTEEKELSA